MATVSPNDALHSEETSVPTLKVMRLQSPELDQVGIFGSSLCSILHILLHSSNAPNSGLPLPKPTAGSLDSKCLLGSSFALPDSFGGKLLTSDNVVPRITTVVV
jgi:hypothetical protein